MLSIEDKKKSGTYFPLKSLRPEPYGDDDGEGSRHGYVDVNSSALGNLNEILGT